MSSDNQRSILWATMDTEGLQGELLRLRRRITEALESGEPYAAVTWRKWTEEILLELELRADHEPTLQSVA